MTKNNNGEILFDPYIIRLVLNKMQEKMKLSDLNGVRPIDHENGIYASKGVKITEQDKINYECQRIKRFIAKKKQILGDPIYRESFRRLAICLLQINSSAVDLNDEETIVRIKKELMMIEISFGMTVAFYSVVESLLQDLECKSNVLKKEC